MRVRRTLDFQVEKCAVYTPENTDPVCQVRIT